MLDSIWKSIEFQQDTETPSWEEFHENSKTGHFDKALTNEQVLAEMANLYESFPYENYKSIPLPDTFAPIDNSLLESVLNRKTPAEMAPSTITLEQWRTILHFGYGETRDNKDNEYISRPFRTVPSGGALYPLELYFFSNGFIEGLEPGLYHYSPAQNAVQLIRPGDHRKVIGESLVSFQSHIADQLSAIIFITGVFNRSIFKYRNKGYRFVMIEAGHVAQNINLAATGMNLGVINIGGYHDRMMDQFLEIDGLNHSTIYLNGICAGNS